MSTAYNIHKLVSILEPLYQDMLNDWDKSYEQRLEITKAWQFQKSWWIICFYQDLVDKYGKEHGINFMEMLMELSYPGTGQNIF